MRILPQVNDYFVISGVSENYYALLEILCACIPRLTVIMCDGSGLQDGSELPTRLSVAAADCFLALTEALTRKTLLSKVPSRNNASNSVVALSRIAENKVEPVTTSSEASNNVELDWLLWDHLDELIVLVQKLVAWNRKSRPLYAKGLEQVLKWLEEIKSHYGNFPDETKKFSRLEYCYFLLVGSITAGCCTWKTTKFRSITKTY